ncbi:N-acetyl-gamma-glutamyl-phosphate reductase [uncultured Parasphingopyxis sp.]|uniref:N-acetyl-gamma-glutamyl-phosphate reductase n=1 Tax=uncultured Parasphingopyxis sp. TaxID=1547918 RepID=UPI00260B925B|nr:N-acetyl-gamma-glutamyl-phosphate reductase [uncultured Parasphingopyxis sp.]
MPHRVFIDGGHGTTGLEIHERLHGRTDFEQILLDDAARKDDDARRDALAAADFAILCLPDDEARKAVALAADTGTRIIDASTAHRIDPDWVFGFAEMEAGQRERIASAKRVSNPGCYALTFITLVRPLVRAGLVAADARISVNATSGYSGGGKAMIAEFESGAARTAFRNYALPLAHKHLPEMRERTGLSHAPLFSPSVANAYRGMLVEIPLWSVDGGAARDTLTSAYDGSRLISVLSDTETEAMGVLPLERCAGTDRLDIIVFENSANGQIRLVGAIDNLGKGAAGSAVQNLNLMAGANELAGLRL